MTLHFDPTHIVWDAFGELEPPQPDWETQLDYWRDYVEKFFLSNGLEFAPSDSNVEQWLMGPERAPFSAMVNALLPRLTQHADLSDTTAILFAHWLPDLHMGTSVTNYTMHKLGLKNCFGFAISDRGLSASLFAFDTLNKYLMSKGGSGLLVVADQKHLLYRSELVERLKPRNAAAILRLDPTNGTGFHYRGYKRCLLDETQTGAQQIAKICQHFELDVDHLTLIGPRTLLGRDALEHAGLGRAALHVTEDDLVCAAPFAALAEGADLSRDQLLLCCDARHVTALAFGGLRR